MTKGIASQKHEFGHEVIGPIMAEFCQRLWLYDRFTPDPEGCVLLFCARGGLRLQALYERFLERMHLKTVVGRQSFMVSRLVAARTGFANPGPGLLAELNREFSSQPMSEVATALAQRELEYPIAWRQPFDVRSFADLLRSGEFEAEHVKALVANQDRMFQLSLAHLLKGRRRAILCDTGLYGSTLRLLSEGIPEIRWSAVQFARCNYKGLPTPHFDRTHGLSVQSDIYVPWNPRTSALRFWQLFEAVLEPDLPSVRSFEFPSGEEVPRSNLEIDGWQGQVASSKPDVYSGTFAYIDELSSQAMPDLDRLAAGAWRKLKRAIIWPDDRMVAVLGFDDRSQDFGRLDKVSQFVSSADGVTNRPALRASLWREGAIRRASPRFGGAWLVVLEMLHSLRAIGSAAQRQVVFLQSRRRVPSPTAVAATSS